VLPGKAGFDFVLKRRYDTATSRADSPGVGIFASFGINVSNIFDLIEAGAEIAEIVNIIQTTAGIAGNIEEEVKNIFRNSGDYAYSMGNGWRLNLPYFRQDNKNILLRLENGSFYSINQMDIVECEGTPVTRKLVLENHEGADFRLEINQVRADIQSETTIDIGALFDGLNPLGELEGEFSWWIQSAVLVMKDGTRYEFNATGKVTKMVDPPGLNEIHFIYDGLLLDYILDSMGRKIRFTYAGLSHGFLLPQIDSIVVEEDDYHRKIEYTQENAHIGFLPTMIPLLTEAADAGDRKWSYEYDNKFLFSGGIGVKVNLLSLCFGLLTKGTSNFLFGDNITISGNISIEWVHLVE
jgi:hypothetical protein